MERYRVEKLVLEGEENGWCVIEWPNNIIATFADSDVSTGEVSAKEYAEKMNAVYAEKNYSRCSESIILTRNRLTELWHWTEALFNKLYYHKYTDIVPKHSVTDTLGMVRKIFTRVEAAINSIPSAEDIEKAINEHKKTNE